MIYIVEDDKDIREMERYALKNSGFDVKTFENGKEFLQDLPRKSLTSYSLILCFPGRTD